MTKDPAPESLLKILSCSRKKGCTGACTCRKAGLKCSNMCKHCSGLTCTNVVELSYDLEDEEDKTMSMIEQIDEDKLDNTDTPYSLIEDEDHSNVFSTTEHKENVPTITNYRNDVHPRSSKQLKTIGMKNVI